jgi:NADH-quinone oxidoreductase subunit A
MSFYTFNTTFQIDFFLETSSNNYYYNYFNEQYSYIIYYGIISLILCCLLFILAFILSPKDITFEKVSPYECGFEPFGESHSIFSIQFFIVGILFMIFDLELAYLFP